MTVDSLAVTLNRSLLASDLNLSSPRICLIISSCDILEIIVPEQDRIQSSGFLVFDKGDRAPTVGSLVHSLTDYIDA